MQLTDWQSATVEAYNTAINEAVDLDALEPVVVELALSTQRWLQLMCWPNVTRRHKELASEEQRMMIVDAMNWIRSDFSMSHQVEETAQTFMRRLRDFSQKLKARWVVIASDDGRNNIRKEIRPEYKSSRDERPSEITEVARKVKVMCEHNQVPYIIYDGYEADDIAATFATKCLARGHKSIICTNDTDYCQLVNKSCVLYSRGEFMNVDGVLKKHGVLPSQILDYLILKGKDDLTSVEGLGEKLSSQLLRKYESFMGIYDHRFDLTETKRLAIEAFAKDYWSVRECHKLKKDLKIEFDWKASNCL